MNVFRVFREMWCEYFHKDLAGRERPSGYMDYYCPRCGRNLGSHEAEERAAR